MSKLPILNTLFIIGSFIAIAVVPNFFLSNFNKIIAVAISIIMIYLNFKQANFIKKSE